MDFETYSEAGYYWDEDKPRVLQKNKTGISIAGAAAYAEHPTTEIICLKYDLLDGMGERMWLPSTPPPTPLFNHIAAGGIIESHNSLFEYFIWLYVAYKRMGWPPLSYQQQVDTMAKCYSHSLPGKLAKAIIAINSSVLKDNKGEALIGKCSVPRKPTKKLPYKRLRPQHDPKTFNEFYDYCGIDIKSEAELSKRIPDLIPQERKLWLIDQAINIRGVYIDQESLHNCISIVEQATKKYTEELQDLTYGAVKTADETAKIKDWLTDRGVHMENMQADTIKDKLDAGTIQGPRRRVLEIRAMLGARSVKKLYAIKYRLSNDGRIRGLFQFAGADRTGRWAGRGPQPQNLPSGGPEVRKCPHCGHPHWTGLLLCPNYNRVLPPTQDGDILDWGIEPVETVLRDISTRSLDLVKANWGNPISAVSGCLRGLFTAAPGHDLICSDYSAIEAVALAELAGETWRQEVFRSHGKIYEMCASKISGIPFDEIIEYEKRTGNHHPFRKKYGKVPELACFGSKTEIFTDKGWKKIVGITTNDLIHDGITFVKHDGVINRGKRLTIKMGSVIVTPDHKFFTGGNSWKIAEDLNRNTHHLKKAIDTANSFFYKRNGKIRVDLWATFVNAPVEISLRMNQVILDLEKVQGVISVLNKNLQLHDLDILTFVPRGNIGADYLTVCPQRFQDVINKIIDNTQFTEVEELKSILPGLTTVENGLNIFAHFLVGIIQKLQSTGLITTETMNRVISVLFPTENNKIIKDRPYGFYTEDKKYQLQNFIRNIAINLDKLERWQESYMKDFRHNRLSNNKAQFAGDRIENVYDILNCGPNNRFVIKTDYGPLIAHNSGYGGAIGAWKNFGADKFMNDQEINANVKIWRSDSPAIVKYWYATGDTAIKAVQNPGSIFTHRGISWGVKSDILYCKLLSDRLLTYHKPRLTRGQTPYGREVWDLSYMGWNSDYKKGPIGWMRIDTWGSKLVENITQATCRDILGLSALMGLEKASYPVVLHVHDEAVAEVKQGWGSIKEVEVLMGNLPQWCKDWPIKATGGWRGLRYRKD